jgi:isopentenyl-diphosphate delta-isomerase
VPVVVKECGTGLAPWVVKRLQSAGVRAVDLSGSGGTSWVKVEALRAQGRQHDLGLLFADWGIPTAAAVAMAADAPLLKIASGGIGDGLAAAKAIALGADVAGFARPVLQAFLAGGADGARAFVDYVLGGLRMATALTGCRRPAELRAAPRILGPRLQAWIEQSRRFER